MKSWPKAASRQLQSRKKGQQKYWVFLCKAIFFSPYLRQAAKIHVPTSHSVARQETTEISLQKAAFVWILAREVDWCLKDCDKQRLQTTVSINLWKIFAGHAGDWFYVKTASICTTELWDALKSFNLNSLKIKVAAYPKIVSLNTLTVPTKNLMAKTDCWLYRVSALTMDRINGQRQSYLQHVLWMIESQRNLICWKKIQRGSETGWKALCSIFASQSQSQTRKWTPLWRCLESGSSITSTQSCCRLQPLNPSLQMQRMFTEYIQTARYSRRGHLFPWHHSE